MSCLPYALLYGVGDQSQDFLVLVEQQARCQMAKSFVGESGRGQELDTLDLAEMCPLTEGEEIQQLGDIVASVAVRQLA